MKKKLKRLAALAVCLVMLFPAALQPASAANDIYFVATERIVLPLTEDTMPFWDKSTLYISGTVFTGLAREEVGISHVVNETNDLMVLYGGGKALIFDINKTYAQDVEENVYYPGAVQRNGNIYVPASLVARYFGLQYSVTGATHGFLIWMRSEDMTLTDRQFAKAATGPMNSRYQEYLKELAAKSEPETPPVVTPPVVTPPVVTPPPVEPKPETPPAQKPVEPEKPKEITGEKVYLCMAGGEQTAAQLDALDSYEAKAAFFCTADFMTQQGALLRRMTATGHSVGILVDGRQNVEEQLQAANAALARATFGKTRLVMLQNGGAEMRAAIEGMGYRCLRADLDRSAKTLRSSADATELLHSVAQRDRDSVVWLGDTVSGVGLRSFMSMTAYASLGGCPAWTETT